MVEYFSALIHAVGYGLGVLVGMSILSYILVALGGGAKHPVVQDDHSHDSHGHKPSPAPKPVVVEPTPAPAAAPVAESTPAPVSEAVAAEEPPASPTEA